MGVVFIAIALVSGFIFTNLHLPSRYRQKRSQGWESYFHFAAWGSLFSFIGVVISIVADYYGIVSLLLNTQHKTLSEISKVLTLSIDDFKMLAITIATLSVALLLGLFSKIVYRYCPGLKIQTIINLMQYDRLDALLMESAITQFPILLNLKSRKAYVGICFTEPSVDSDNDFIEVLPLISGYREKDTLELKLVTNYFAYYKKMGIDDDSHDYLSQDDFRTIVSRSELDSVSFFDIETFNSFNSVEKNKIPTKKILPQHR